MLTGRLHLAYIDGRTWQVRQVAPAFGCDTHWGHVSIPDGMPTDFASIPRWAQWLLPPEGGGPSMGYGQAAVIHDRLYATGRTEEREIGQAEADLVFFSVMVETDVHWLPRFVMWLALRLGGWVAWKRYRKADNEG